MVTLKERAHTETVIHQQKDPMDGTRRLKVLKYLRQNTPGNIPRSSVRALEKLPAKVLSTLHAGSDLRQITEDPRLRNWLAANPVPSSKASVQAPLFQGTRHSLGPTSCRSLCSPRIFRLPSPTPLWQ